MILEHWPEPPQLGPGSPDRCDVFPVALGVEPIYLNRRGSIKVMLCAAIGTALDGWPILSTRSIEAATLLRMGNSPLSAPVLASGWGLRPERMVLRYARSQEYAPGFCRCHYGVFA
jgi:hypothetical protein